MFGTEEDVVGTALLGDIMDFKVVVKCISLTLFKFLTISEVIPNNIYETELSTMFYALLSTEVTLIQTLH